MSLKGLQEQVDEWIRQYKIGYFQPLEIIARLAEECGEVARELNHLYGSKPKKPTEEKRELGQEIADVIFTLCCLANSQGIDLDAAWKEIMDKCYARDTDRWEKK